VVKELPLTKGYVALVDDEDFERVNAFRWSAMIVGHHADGSPKVYAHRKEARKTSYLHRFILDALKGVYVDHKNGDGLDNRRANLRICTQSQNIGNSRMSSANTTGYKGVYLVKASGRYSAKIGHRNRSCYLGIYSDPAFAAHVYDAAARHFFGQFALTNFQESNPDAEAIIAARFDRDERIAA
jgi:hypothetical protein